MKTPRESLVELRRADISTPSNLRDIYEYAFFGGSGFRHRATVEFRTRDASGTGHSERGRLQGKITTHS